MKVCSDPVVNIATHVNCRSSNESPVQPLSLFAAVMVLQDLTRKQTLLQLESA